MDSRILGLRLPAFTGLWLATVVAIYGTVSALGAGMLRTERNEADARHVARMSADEVEAGRTAPDTAQANADVPERARVKAGIYLDRVTDLSITGTAWMADFYIWFVWSDPELHPGAEFRIVGGDILSRTLAATDTIGDQRYELYRVTARLTKYFNTTRYPVDEHLLTIHIEDGSHDVSQLVFVPDLQESDVSSRVEIPGFVKGRFELVAKPHSYKSNLGDPAKPPNQKDTYSQLICGLHVLRPGWGVYFKMFQALFASVLVALLALAVLPSNNPRFGLGVGAFFASIATTYVTNRQLPDAGILTMTDIINGVGMGTIFLTLIHSALALHMQHCDIAARRIRLFDDLGLLVFGVGYVATNAALALAAA